MPANSGSFLKLLLYLNASFESLLRTANVEAGPWIRRLFVVCDHVLA